MITLKNDYIKNDYIKIDLTFEVIEMSLSILVC